MVSYPRRQQLRRLKRAAVLATGSVAALAAAVANAPIGEPWLAFALGLTSVLLALACRHAWSLAGRSRVGAASEARVRQALEVLERDGWRVRHSLDWPGPGDLDHVVRAPSGVGFMIETKTLRYTRAQLARAAHAARGSRANAGGIRAECVR